MLDAMLTATQGDAVYEEDDDTNSLQARVAKIAGKEAGIFMVSGTLSNQVALRCHLYQPPHSILCDHRAHVYTCEAAGLAILSQAMVTPVIPSNGVYLTLEDVKAHIIDYDDIHVAPTKVISLENTLGGSIMPLEEIKRISEYARSINVKMHLDGARLWHASAETGIPMDEYCKYFDSISLCLSKGMGAPVGSVLVSNTQFIKKARWIAKQQGGGIRQSGLLTAAANVALDEVFPVLANTHKMAKETAKFIDENYGVKPEIPVDTSFIFLDAKRSGLDLAIFKEEGTKRGLKLLDNRLVFHHQICLEAVELLKESIKVAMERSRANGLKPIAGTFGQSGGSSYGAGL
ncbi:hypothetical protein D0Z03_002441 [Geotrichum reessii]|nr:hypothetical protein D0Z03_002441 [Galactomyces reessii]